MKGRGARDCLPGRAIMPEEHAEAGGDIPSRFRVAVAAQGGGLFIDVVVERNFGFGNEGMGHLGG